MGRRVAGPLPKRRVAGLSARRRTPDAVTPQPDLAINRYRNETVNPIIALLGAQPADGSNPLTGTLFMFVAIGAIFYFLIIRPQRQQQKQHESMVQSLNRGDEVVTMGGVIGKIVHVADDRVVIKSGETRIEVERSKIGRKLSGAEKGSPAK